MELIVITPDGHFAGETEIVNELFRSGLSRLHLRKKEYSETEYRNYLNGIEQQYHSKLVITENFHLFSEFDLAGIHLNSHFRDKPKALETISKIDAGKISTSFHSWQEIRENEVPYKYVFISPIFNSISKVGYMGTIDTSQVYSVRQELNDRYNYCPDIYGLGGINDNEARILKEAGFDGAALLGAIWLSADPVKAFCAIRDAVN